MAFGHAPVQPAHFVVLAVGVVVALLGACDFVARENHGNAVRKQQNGGKVFSLTRAQLVPGGIVARAFPATIPTVVGVGAISVVLAVGEIVLLVVGNQIVEREAIVAGHEVDAVVRFAGAGLVEVGTAQQTGGERRGHAGIALYELAHIVAINAIPLRPSSPGRQRTDLIQPDGIPGLGDQF